MIKLLELDYFGILGHPSGEYYKTPPVFYKLLFFSKILVFLFTWGWQLCILILSVYLRRGWYISILPDNYVINYLND